MDDEKTELLAEAQRCRRLAAAITDPDTIARLKALAEEYERRADATPNPKDGSSRFGAAGEDYGRRHRRGTRRPAMAGSAALEIVPFGQVEQPPPGERVRLLCQIARALREASVEILHDAAPQHH